MSQRQAPALAVASRLARPGHWSKGHMDDLTAACDGASTRLSREQHPAIPLKQYVFQTWAIRLGWSRTPSKVFHALLARGEQIISAYEEISPLNTQFPESKTPTLNKNRDSTEPILSQQIPCQPTVVLGGSPNQFHSSKHNFSCKFNVQIGFLIVPFKFELH